MSKEQNSSEDIDIEAVLRDGNWDLISMSDLNKQLTNVIKSNEDEFIKILRQIPNEQLSVLLLEFSEKKLSTVLNQFPINRWVDIFDSLESDDATDLFQYLEDIDQDKAEEIFKDLDFREQNKIKRLKRYSDDVAGAYMQTELFEAKYTEKIQDAINRLRKEKKKGELENIHQVFVTGIFNRVQGVINLEDLIIFDFNKTFEEILDENGDKFKPISVTEETPIEEAVQLFMDFELSSMPVINELGSLMGRITSDDIIDVVEESATDQLYGLAGVDDDAEQEEGISQAGKKRAGWLLVNMCTALTVATVISTFQDTIHKVVALAVLMPIVASIGGNAGTQTLTVIVRKLALGEIELSDSKNTFRKELSLAMLNGALFATLVGTIAAIWFQKPIIGVIILSAMFINMLCAGFFGTLIPLLLKKFDFDPAVGSTVLLTAVTDVVGFFSFLGIAKLLL